MKKLIFLLLVLLPLQATWAAMSGYCGHEQGAAAKHIGHHAHQHDSSSDDDDTRPGKIHYDCSACHVVGTAVVVAEFWLPADAPATFMPDGLSTSFLSAFSQRPERPNWVSSV